MTQHDPDQSLDTTGLEAGDGVPSLASALASDGLALADTSELQASMSASMWLGAAWLSRAEPDDDADRDLVEQALGAVSEPGGWTALFALATIAPAALRNRLADELEKCPPLERPQWARLGYERPLPAETTVVSDPLGEEQLYLLRYEQPEPHDLMVSVTHAGGTIVRSIEVVHAEGLSTGDLEAIITHPDAETALGELAVAMDYTDRYWPPFDDAEYVHLRALLRHRTEGFGAEQHTLSDAEWEELVAGYTAAARAEGSDLSDDDLEMSAGSFLEYGSERLAGGPLAWTPGDVEHFLLDWTPNDELLDEDEAADLPRLLKVWLRFIGRRRDLAREQVEALVGEVDRLEPQYLDWFGTAFTEDADELTRLFRESPQHETDAGPGARSASGAQELPGVRPADPEQN